MTTGMVHDQNLQKRIDKHMGCMGGFLHIFDRHQMLTGKRNYSTKRLPSPTEANSSPEPDTCGGSPTLSRELEKHQPRSTPFTDPMKQSSPKEPQSQVPEAMTSTETPVSSPLPLPVFEFKDGTRSSWKFSRDAPRLSLDSRAVVDTRGSLRPREIRTNTPMLSTKQCQNPGGAEIGGDQHRRSTSVIARLMGLEPLPDSDPEPVKKAELRRSASESRVCRDFLQYRFFDSNFQLKQLQHQSNSQRNISSNGIRDNAATMDNRSTNGRMVNPKEFSVRNGKKEPPRAPLKGIGLKKSFYDTADFFPEPKHNVSIHGEIEKRLKMKGIDEPSMDLEALKQILEALQLKGLLHSKKSTTQTNQRNFVLKASVSANDSPIIVMKPMRCPSSLTRPGRAGIDSPPSSLRLSPRAHRNLNIANETLTTVSPRRERPKTDQSIRNKDRVRNSTSPTTTVKSPNKKVVNGEAQKKMNDPVDPRRVSPVHSPKFNSKRNVAEQQGTTRSPRMRKPTAEVYHKEKVLSAIEDESSATSESSSNMTSQTDTESYKSEEYRGGRDILERCDKLLHSIAEITVNDSQPSPVSVLDSSLYKDESSSPSPVLKRYIDINDQQGETKEDIWGAAMCSMEAKTDDTSEDCDFLYVSEILQASNYLQEDSDVFLLLEKQQYLKGKATSKASTLQRRLIFDTIHEILNRKQQLPPWKQDSNVRQTPSVERIWWELRRIQERDESEDLFEVICGVLRKDLAEDAMNGWGECPTEKGDVVLDMERLIFKDLIGEAIRDLASITEQRNKISPLCRKLVF